MANRDVQSTFEGIFERESNAVFRFCVTRVSDREQALDITQETFTRLWQTVSDGTAMNNARAFLFTVANHLIIDWYRKKKALSLDEEWGSGEEEAEPPDETTVRGGLELKAEGRYLVSKIDELEPIYRQAVYLRFVEGMSPGEIGEVLHISPNAASVRVNRGLDELKKLTGYQRVKLGKDRI